MPSEAIYSYEVFDLNFISKGLKISELEEVKKSDKNKVFIEESDASKWPVLTSGQYDTEFLQMKNNDLRLKVNGVGQFRILGGNRIFWSKENKGVSDQDIIIFMLGSAFGSILIQRGTLVLHGNALSKGNKAIICLGHSGYGKSTLAFALIEEGWKMLSDDLVALSPEFKILPGIPTLKLWEDAVLTFNLELEKLRAVRDGLNKYLYIPSSKQYSKKKLPIHSIFLLREESSKKFDNCELFSINKIESDKRAVLILRNHSYRPRFIRGMGKEGTSFVKLIELQRKIPLKTLDLPIGINNLQKMLKSVELIKGSF